MSEDAQVIEMVNRNHEAWEQKVDRKVSRLRKRKRAETLRVFAKCGIYLAAVAVLLVAVLAGWVATWLGVAVMLGVAVVGAADVLGDVLLYALRWRL